MPMQPLLEKEVLEVHDNLHCSTVLKTPTSLCSDLKVHSLCTYLEI